MSKVTAEERAKALAELQALLKPGQTVYTILRHVSSSGMSRIIDLVIPYTQVNMTTVEATEAGKALKPGAKAYGRGTDGEAKAWTSGCVVGTDHGGAEVVIRYDDDTTATWPLDRVAVYVSGKPFTTIRSIGWLAARAMGDTFVNDKHYGIKVGGCGMDMGFHLVYNLGRTVWPDGTKKPHGSRNGKPDKDGGYALKHVWL